LGKIAILGQPPRKSLLEVESMVEEKTNGIKLPPVEQVGIVVKDMDKAIEFYGAVFGWGPFNVSEFELKGCIYRGKPSDCRLKLAMAQSGPVEIELIQVLEGETPHSEFLREKGEGLHHLRFSVDDLDGVLAEWAKEGVEPVWYHSMPEIGVSWAYLNTDRVGGAMVELIEMKEVQS
jgi:catechol 2,3-dioxygenase-like lactoylglutathione lyase family enzyme